MSDDLEEKLDEKAEDKDLVPIEVKIVNKDKKEVSDYDTVDNEEYDDLGITQKQVEEFENGDTSSK